MKYFMSCLMFMSAMAAPALAREVVHPGSDPNPLSAGLRFENCNPFADVNFVFENRNLDRPEVILMAPSENSRMPMIRVSQNQFEFDVIFDTAILRVDSLNQKMFAGEIRYKIRKQVYPITCEVKDLR